MRSSGGKPNESLAVVITGTALIALATFLVSSFAPPTWPPSTLIANCPPSFAEPLQHDSQVFQRDEVRYQPPAPAKPIANQIEDPRQLAARAADEHPERLIRFVRQRLGRGAFDHADVIGAEALAVAAEETDPAWVAFHGEDFHVWPEYCNL